MAGRKNLSPLLMVEAVAVVVFGVLLGMVLLHPEEEGSLQALDPAALATGPASDRWMGIFFEDQPVGYSVTSEATTADGGRVIQARSVFQMVQMGEIKQVITAGTALVDAGRQLRRFDILWDADPVRLVARGEVQAADLVLEVFQGGEIQRMTVPLQEPPQINLSLPTAIAGQELAVGRTFQIPYFDPVSLAQSTMDVAVTGVEVLPGGEEAYWLTTRFAGMETRKLVTPAGETIREEGGLGLSLVRMTREEAENIVKDAKPVDLIAMAAIRPAGAIDDSRSAATVTLRFTGVEPDRIRHEPPLQSREGDTIRIQVPLLAEIPALPLLAPDTPEAEPFASTLAGEPFLPVDHLDIRSKATEIVAGAANRTEAARRLADWVFEKVEKRPVAGVPNGLEVLRRLEGDCNEHTVLYVSLARAAGIPARIAAGVVYTDRIDGEGAFYYHAWPEVHLGGPTGWVPIDPTFGEFPADATHLKLAEGNLDSQLEIIGVMGRLRLEVVEAR